jgi:hypothetical protein
VFNGNLVLGDMFVHRYGAKKPLNGCFAKKRERKNKVLICVLIINHFNLNEDELELGTKVGGDFSFNVGRVFDF